jgi:nicotinamidase-related amidase
MTMERLDPSSTLLFVIDVQERLAAAMPEPAMSQLVTNTKILAETAKVLSMAVVVSEQYPKGLGATIAPIADALPGVTRLPKMTFDACSDLAIARVLTDRHPRSVIVVGMETHICVFQTARELVKRGLATYVIADAVTSRREEDRKLGLALADRAGAYVAPVEAVVFDLLERAGTDAFRTISSMFRAR